MAETALFYIVFAGFVFAHGALYAGGHWLITTPGDSRVVRRRLNLAGIIAIYGLAVADSSIGPPLLSLFAGGMFGLVTRMWSGVGTRLFHLFWILPVLFAAINGFWVWEAAMELIFPGISEWPEGAVAAH